ncbi:hypothetical protein [Nocardioides terrigena]|uniref:hypothetical protein n=1 Tax=Nocardioides terrigena TaxID=424797 RepID=UPI00131EEB5C|nr:hypothetical protein [Nocardioides terrigena]
MTRAQVMLGASYLVAICILAASAYGLLADEPYRDLPEATVFAAQGQDVVSLLVAVGLVFLALPARLTPTRLLAWLGLLAYVVYSYAIYLIGVPMNQVFLVYVVLESVAGAALLAGLWRLASMRWPTTASTRLRHGTGWMLIVVAVLFAGLWLSTLLPYAFGGSPPEPEGLGGAPYPVFVLDLVVVLPAIAAVGVMLLRGHRLGPPLAVVALIKIVTLFVALWAGPAYALATDGPVDLGPDAGPTLLLLVVSSWLVTRWWRALTEESS